MPKKEEFFVHQNPVLPYDGSLDDEKLSSLHQGMCNTQLKEFYTPIQHVYIDLRYLKDYVLGAIFAMANKQERQYILSRIQSYNTRMRDTDILSFFPDVQITEEALATFLKDPTNTDALILRSPTTDFYENLHIFCSMIIQHNQRIQLRCATKFCINFYPFEPSPLVKNFFANLIQGIDPRCSLTVMKTPLHILPKDILLPGNTPFFQIMGIYDFVNFTSEKSTVCREFLEFLLFSKTIIYAPRRVSDEMEIPDNPLQCKDMFASTEALMRICSQFTYLDPLLPIE